MRRSCPGRWHGKSWVGVVGCSCCCASSPAQSASGHVRTVPNACKTPCAALHCTPPPPSPPPLAYRGKAARRTTQGVARGGRGSPATAPQPKSQDQQCVHRSTCTQPPTERQQPWRTPHCTASCKHEASRVAAITSISTILRYHHHTRERTKSPGPRNRRPHDMTCPVSLWRLCSKGQGRLRPTVGGGSGARAICKQMVRHGAAHPCSNSALRAAWAIAQVGVFLRKGAGEASKCPDKPAAAVHRACAAHGFVQYSAVRSGMQQRAKIGVGGVVLPHSPRD